MINKNTTFYEIYNLQRFAECKDYFFAKARHARYFKSKDMTIADITNVKPGWDPDDIIYGINRLIKVSNKEFFYSVYNSKEIAVSSDKEDVKMFYFPSDKQTDRFAIILSGGAFAGNCNVPEGFPIAAKLNDLGYDAFVLCYRVKQDALMPKPLDDIAAAYNFIINNFKVDKNNYILVGSSAGATLAIIFGEQKYGYKHYKMPKPKLLLCEYPFISFSLKPSLYIQGIEKIMFGDTKDIHTYDIENNIDSDYPITYAVISENDEAVNYKNLVLFDQQLTLHNIKHKCDIVKHSGHGFGLGSKTECNGWIEKGLELINL